jgi:SAM-dependent methyltransferase
MASDFSLPPLRAALLAQLLGALMAIGLLALVAPRLLEQPLLVAALQGLCAAFTSYKLDSPPWWHAIHLGFMPLVVAASGLGLAPGWYLAGFVVLLAVFWRVSHSRVPLYLSNEQTAAAVAALLPGRPCRIVDLGCGNGALLRHLARLRPDCDFLGIEYAPLPWLWARLRCSGYGNCRVAYGDFWHRPLAGFDLVYAFLSPVPMTKLWAKANAEMRAESMLVSNTFEVPNREPDRVVDVPDRRRTRLYCYRPAGGGEPAGSR